MDWLLVRYSLPNDPRVLALANALQIDSDCIVGKLIRVWAHAGLHGDEGYIKFATATMIDNIARQAGMGRAMADAGWCQFDLGGCRLISDSTPSGASRT
jgi:hypothetical protein